MVKLCRGGGKDNEQYKLTVPVDIIKLTGWNENTELVFVPFIKEANDGINTTTPILLKEMNKAEVRK